ncbi:MAG: aldo/keto reductase, partial [Candidatus Rokuibacteriota bacterium]
MATLIPGSATSEGTTRYAARLAGRVAAGHFGDLDGLAVSTLGIGTYLGREDAETDVAYQDALVRALELGINTVDTAVNYRHQRSERAIRTALAAAFGRGLARRDEVVVATKGGYVPFDGAVPRDPRAWFTQTYLDTGIVGPGDVVGGIHCIAPRYLADQIERSRANLGLETLDIYYVHNPESQL